MRKKRLIKNNVLVEDPKFCSIVVSRFINYSMLGGKKEKSTRIVYRTLEKIKDKVPGLDSLQILNQAIENIRPLLGLRSRKIGGGKVQVPFEIPHDKSVTLALKSIIDSARKTRQSRAKSMWESLVIEIVDAFNKTGESFKNNQNLQKMAIANLAFSFHQRF